MPAIAAEILITGEGEGTIRFASGEVVSGNRTGFGGEVLGRSYYLVKKSSIITGRDLRSARRSARRSSSLRPSAWAASAISTQRAAWRRSEGARQPTRWWGTSAA